LCFLGNKISMKHLKTFDGIFVWRPLRVRIIKLVVVCLSNMPRLTKDQRVCMGFMVSPARHCMREKGHTFYDEWINVYSTIMFLIRSFGHDKTI
jgi:hypothetical protein